MWEPLLPLHFPCHTHRHKSMLGKETTEYLHGGFLFINFQTIVETHTLSDLSSPHRLLLSRCSKANWSRLALNYKIKLALNYKIKFISSIWRNPILNWLSKKEMKTYMDESWNKLVNYEKYQIVKSRLDYQLVDSESSKNEINNSYNSLYSLVHTICHSSLSFQLILPKRCSPKATS